MRTGLHDWWPRQCAPQLHKGLCAVNGQVLSTYTVTAREAHLCGERGSPAAGKGIVSLWLKFMDRHGDVQLTLRASR